MSVLRFAAGLALWALAAVVVSPAAAKAMLVVPLLLVPYMAADARLPTVSLARILRIELGWLALVCAVPLVAAYAIPPGPVAALLSVPWLAACVGFGGVAVVHGLQHLPTILRPSHADELLADASLVLLAVGAAFALLERLGMPVLDLGRNIVLITAVHFHVLGFGLVGVAAALAAKGSLLATSAGYAFLFGIPVTAAGFTFASTFAQWLGSIPVAAGGLLVAGALAVAARDSARWRGAALVVAAGTLVVGVPMGVLWATAVLFEFPFVDFRTMVAVHGVLNTIGTTAGALAVSSGRSCVS